MYFRPQSLARWRCKRRLRRIFLRIAGGAVDIATTPFPDKGLNFPVEVGVVGIPKQTT